MLNIKRTILMQGLLVAGLTCFSLGPVVAAQTPNPGTAPQGTPSTQQKGKKPVIGQQRDKKAVASKQGQAGKTGGTQAPQQRKRADARAGQQGKSAVPGGQQKQGPQLPGQKSAKPQMTKQQKGQTPGAQGAKMGAQQQNQQQKQLPAQARNQGIPGRPGAVAPQQGPRQPKLAQQQQRQLGQNVAGRTGAGAQRAAAVTPTGTAATAAGQPPKKTLSQRMSGAANKLTQSKCPPGFVPQTPEERVACQSTARRIAGGAAKAAPGVAAAGANFMQQRKLAKQQAAAAQPAQGTLPQQQVVQ